MRKGSYFTICLLSVALVLASCRDEDDAPAPEEGVEITMTFPDDWDNTNRFGDPVVLVGTSPPELGTDTFRENVNVVTEEAPDATLSSYYDATLEALNDFQNFTVLSTQDTILNGYRAKKVIFTAESNQTTLQFMDYILHEKETGIIVTCTALEESFARYEATFNQIVGTIQVK